MITFIPGVESAVEFFIPDENGDNIDGLTWTAKLFKNGVEVTVGAEFGTLSIDAIGTTGYKAVFTPMTDGARYMITAKSNLGDAWMENYVQADVRLEGSPAYDNATEIFRFQAQLVADGKLVDCSSATAILYEGGDQATVEKNLGSGAEGALNVFHWAVAAVEITQGIDYIVRVTFTVSAPGSPSTPVTVVRDLAFLA